MPCNYNNGLQIFQSRGCVVRNLDRSTLVVETSNFNGGASLTNFGVPGSPREPQPGFGEVCDVGTPVA